MPQRAWLPPHQPTSQARPVKVDDLRTPRIAIANAAVSCRKRPFASQTAMATVFRRRDHRQNSGCRKRRSAKGVRSLFSFSELFRSLFGHLFCDFFRHFFAKLLLPDSFCGRVKSRNRLPFFYRKQESRGFLGKNLKLLGPKRLLRFFPLRQTITIAITEKSRHLVHSEDD